MAERQYQLAHPALSVRGGAKAEVLTSVSGRLATVVKGIVGGDGGEQTVARRDGHSVVTFILIEVY